MSPANASAAELLLAEFDRLIRRDPARRGLIESEGARGPLCPEHLAAAADHVARFAREVWLITGFYIPRGQPPAAETDGPPGTALLAAVLSRCGRRVRILTDGWCSACVQVAAELYGLPPGSVWVVPEGLADADDWIRRHLAQSPELSHIISIERVGPSHSGETLVDQGETRTASVRQFLSETPPEHWNRCHNMRGEIIDSVTAPLHRVFELACAERPGVRTIGIGDGGNELGLGAVPWLELRSRLSGAAAPLVPCRIPADWTILAGVSNWGAAALAAGTAYLCNEVEAVGPFDAAFEERALQELVARGPAVDGVTRLCEPTVDGLPFLTYLQPWLGMRRRLGLSAGDA